jgi:hypothetical protein
MSFDQNNPAPAMQPGKKTTQVNIWMAVAVIVFLGAGALAVVWYHHRSVDATRAVDQKVNPTQPAP